MPYKITNLIVAITLLSSPAFASSEDASYLTAWFNQSSLTFDTTHVSTEPLKAFYAAHQYQPVWVDEHGLNDRAQKVLAQLNKANEDGLNPSLYHIDTLQRIASSDDGDATRHMQVRLSLDIMMSDAVLHYVANMQRGLAQPQGDNDRAELSNATQTNWLNQLAASENPDVMLQSMAPQSPAYAALKTTLRHYQDIAAQGGWPAFVAGKPIKPNTQDARIESLRQILTLTGDLPAASAPTADLTYNTAMVDAVKHFQSRHGIEADGVLNASTQKSLAVPVGKRIEQMELTLERMRWMPRDMGGRYVLVNVPAYQLHAVDGTQQLNMNVIVGKPSTPTPLFSKNITNVAFNPSWGVPAKIAMKEMLPKIRKNPAYLANAGYTLTENGHEVDASAVDWSSVGNGHFPYAIRQNPGEGNALGKVKFLIPDSDDVYLHDTSNHNLFAKSDRDLSHGCVRLSDPEALTKFVLQAEGWSAGKIEATYDSDTSRTVSVKPLPVYLVYWTSWVDGQGQPHFANDIYGKDQALVTAMRNAPTREESVKLAMN